MRIRLQHECPFLELSNIFSPGLSYGYCCRFYDVLSLPGKITDEHLDVARKGFPNVDEWRISNISDKVTYIQMPCLCETLYEPSITGLIQDQGGLIKYPITYKDGWEYYNILAFDSQVQKKIIDQLQIPDNSVVVEWLSINDLGIKGLFQSQMISMPELIGGLTEHQLTILLSAFERGYYSIPRGVRTKDIADEIGISRYAVDKVIRSAENKIIAALIPYLYFKLNLDEYE